MFNHPYVVAWCRYMGSKNYWIEDQLEKAGRESAPETAIYRKQEGGWVTLEELQNEPLQQALVEYVAQLQKVVAG